MTEWYIQHVNKAEIKGESEFAMRIVLSPLVLLEFAS